MRNTLTNLSLICLLFIVSCDPKDKQQVAENPVEQKELSENGTPEQYQGSTGVEDGDNNNLEAEENIELKRQEFTGSFSSEFTQKYNFTVINPSTYHFQLVTENPEIAYTVKNETGETIIDVTKEDSSAELKAGEYVINAELTNARGEKDVKNTEFKILIN